jgi:hypothetical protein
VPFAGLFAVKPWVGLRSAEIWGIVLPAMILLGMGLWALWRRIWAPEIWALLVNIEVCVVGLTASSYDFLLAPARIAMGVALAALLCLPRFDSLVKRAENVWVSRALWLGVCTVLWLLLAQQWLANMARIYPA